jgi:anti-sigma B factor antagonist
MMTQLESIGRLETTELLDDVVLVSVTGPLDARIAHDLRDLLYPLGAGDGLFLVLDLGDAHGLDDEALGVISDAAHLIQRFGGRLPIVTRSRSISSRLEECGLTDIVSIHGSLEGAIHG